ncbi:chemotaxis protein [Thalassotalea insulae]|uniref:Chemotaxis protein n=1 Tax=Thalassotalea insulae TaxID=2056778 RepID=A0ABQ6GNH8_9GAMM|nr:DUF3379 family protein [Thalassotalea insulae]GLX77550.1 chemotaxis protein [Thalassotalea insulae]
MDDLQFRRSIYADPNTSDEEVRAAKHSDPAKRKFAEEIEQLDQQIAQALHIDVPQGLSEKLILRQSLASHQQQKKASRIKLALAASVTFAIGLIVHQLQFSHAYSSISDYAIAHTNHEAQYFSNQDEVRVSLTSLNKKMASFNGSFSEQLGELLMAEFCRFDGTKSLHLVFRGQTSPVNIFIVPDNEYLTVTKRFTDNNLNGVVNQFKHSNIIVVGDKQEPLEQWQNKISQTVQWST